MRVEQIKARKNGEVDEKSIINGQTNKLTNKIEADL